MDKTDNQPIAGAVVEVVSSDIKSVTSNEGYFTISGFKNNAGYLKISSMGYIGSFTYLSDTISEITVLLEPSVRDLETVVVTASRSEKKLKDVPVVTQVLYADRLQKLGITTVGAALEKEVPGLEFSKNSLMSKSDFQGLNAKYLLFLVDGERLSGEMDGDIDYSRLNLEQVERIEIVRGASSVLYGSNAIGGVVNIITRVPAAKYQQDAGVYFSKFNEIRVNNSVGMKTDAFSSLSSFNYGRTNGYNVNTDDTSYKTQYKMYDMSARQGFVVDVSKDLKLNISGNIFYKRIFDGDALLSPSDHGYFSYSGMAKAAYIHQDSSRTSVSYGIDSYSNYDILFLRNDEMRKYASDRLQNVKIQHQFVVRRHTLNVGNENQYENLFSNRITEQNKTLFETSLFVQDEYAISNSIQVTGGLRFTYNEHYKTNVVPRFTLMYKTIPIVYRASFGMGFRSPSLKDLYYEFDHFGSFRVLGNKDLKPEKSAYYSLSAEYNAAHYYVIANVYVNDVKDMINYIYTDSVSRIYQYENIDKALIKGADVISGFKLFSRLGGTLGVSFVDAIDRKNNKQAYGVAPISVNAGLTYSYAIGKYKQSVEIFDRITGRREFTPVNEIKYIDPPYQIVRITYSSAIPFGFYASLGVDNVFDKVMPGSLGNTSPGRRFFVSLRYSFKKF